MNFTYRVLINSQQVKRYESHSYRRFVQETNRINWRKEAILVTLRVNYGQWTVNGKQIEPHNFGEFTNEKDFWDALIQFKESER